MGLYEVPLSVSLLGFGIEHENRPHRRPSRIKVVTFPVQLLHS